MAVVGIDYWPAVTHAPGVGRHARELVRALVRLETAPELRLFEVGPLPRVVPPSALGLEGARRVLRRRARVPRRALGALFELTGVGADRLLGGVDLFQRSFPDHPPLGDVPQVLPISELPAEGSDAERKLKRALETIGDVLVMSAGGALAVERRLGLARERIHPVPVGCDHWRRELARLPERDGVPTVLVLGALRPGRGHTAILAAARRLRRRGREVRLTFIGRRGSAAAALEGDLAGEDAFEWIESLPESDLPERVARCSVLVHLAREELTAVTPLEAFSLGLAVVASPLEAFREALGDEAVWCGDSDLDVLADAIDRALAMAADAAATQRRIEIAARYPWSEHARATCAVWTTILERWTAQVP